MWWCWAFILTCVLDPLAWSQALFNTAIITGVCRRPAVSQLMPSDRLMIEEHTLYLFTRNSHHTSYSDQADWTLERMWRKVIVKGNIPVERMSVCGPVLHSSEDYSQTCSDTWNSGGHRRQCNAYIEERREGLLRRSLYAVTPAFHFIETTCVSSLLKCWAGHICTSLIKHLFPIKVDVLGIQEQNQCTLEDIVRKGLNHRKVIASVILNGPLEVYVGVSICRDTVCTFSFSFSLFLNYFHLENNLRSVIWHLFDLMKDTTMN